MRRIAADQFYEIEKRETVRSLSLFLFLILFYLAAVGLISLAVVATFGFLVGSSLMASGVFWFRFLLFVVLASVLIAFFHFMDARKFGASFILKRLGAAAPDKTDRHHKQLLNTVDEIRIAAGLPAVKAYVLSSFGVNSMALIEKDGTPAVAVTEGLLADCTRDELQAVVAHELAHIARGDVFFVTLVCSLANFFEKIKDALTPEKDDNIQFLGSRPRGKSGGSPGLVLFAAAVSSLVMHALSMLLSRQREYLADAAAVEFCRNPASLARALYKSSLKSSLIGDFSSSYGPIFIVPPFQEEESPGFFGRLFSSHPPVMKRIGLLAGMADLSAAEIVRQVWESAENREKARGVLYSHDELMTMTRPAIPIPETTSFPSSGRGSETGDGRIWMIRVTCCEWQGPYTLDDLVGLPAFKPLVMVKNVQERIEAKAREFPQIRQALHQIRRNKSLVPARSDLCPRCHVPLSETFYEGVPIKLCLRCQGKLADASLMDRIISRREVKFSDDLIRKAHEFRDQFFPNPAKICNSKLAESRDFLCPDCGYKLIARPYNYQYFVPVEKCLSCHKIWFEADELEILQILIEKL